MDNLKLLRYNTGTDKQVLIQFKDEFSAVIFNATIVAYSRSAVADLVSVHKNLYIIDPQTHIYQQSIGFVAEKFQILSGIFQFLPLHQIFPYMAGAAMLLGLGIGFFASFFTIRKHLKV